jgi:CRP-like cAMP-binding protein
VEEGRVDVVLVGPNGARRSSSAGTSVGRKEPGDFFGEMGFLVPGPASARVVAVDPCRFVRLTHEGLVRLRNEGSAVAARLVGGICRDLAERLRSFADAGAEGADGRTASVRPLVQRLFGVDRRAPLFDVQAEAAAQSAAQVSSPGQLVESLDLLEPAEADAAYRVALRNDIAAMGRLVPLDLREVAGGQVLFREGDAADGAYLILEGAIRVVADRGQGLLHVDRTVGSGSVVGLVAFFAGGKRTATCTTVGQTRLVRFPTLGVRLLLEEAPKGALGVYLLDWFGRQLVADARALNQGIAAALAEGDAAS